jgi:1-acyl-sn-glycerol-3-phosphate acyltransferase
MSHPRAGRVLRLVRWTRLLAHVGAALFILRLVFPRASRERRRALHGWWSRKLVRILGMELRVQGPVPEAGERGAMISANHVSWLDVFLVSSVRPTRFIAKSEVREWPVAGWIAERAGTLFVRRARRRDTARINEIVHGALADGDCVGLFPEGTTTMGDRLLKFHSSLFEPAVANAAHVHPLAIRYEHADGSLCRAAAYDDLTFMQSLSLIARQRGVVARLMFAQSLEAKEATRRDLAHATQDRIATLLGLPSPGSEPRKAADQRAASP